MLVSQKRLGVRVGVLLSLPLFVIVDITTWRRGGWRWREGDSGQGDGGVASGAAGCTGLRSPRPQRGSVSAPAQSRPSEEGQAGLKVQQLRGGGPEARGGVVLLEGDEGAGKSRLLEEVRRAAAGAMLDGQLFFSRGDAAHSSQVRCSGNHAGGVRGCDGTFRGANMQLPRHTSRPWRSSDALRGLWYRVQHV